MTLPPVLTGASQRILIEFKPASPALMLVGASGATLVVNTNGVDLTESPTLLVASTVKVLATPTLRSVTVKMFSVTVLWRLSFL
jgi:hypothetical protein